MAKRHDYVRDEKGRFAPVPGTHRNQHASKVSPGSSRSRGRSPVERLGLTGADVASKRLRASSNPHAQAVGVALSVAGSVYRNPQVQAALKKRTKRS